MSGGCRQACRRLPGRRLQAFLAVLLACGLVPPPADAELSANVEPKVIDELGTARLTIRATGSNQTQALELSSLEEDFDVLGTQSASQYRAVNGQVEAWVEYQISLRPRRAGTLTVPPVRIGAESTGPLQLTVRPVDSQVRDSIDRMVYFETELSNNPVYVQAETVLTRRLFYSSGAQIYSDLPGIPEVANAVVRALGDTRSSTTFLDGQRYGVIEQKFAILPEQSGTLIIPSIAVTSSVRLESNGRMRRSGVRVSTDELKLEVLPVPREYPADQPWLPATAVTVTDQWSPDNGRVSVGEPVSRDLEIRVTGNVAAAIPVVKSELAEASLREYPEPPYLQDDASGSSVVGLRRQSYALVATQPGAAQIPKVSITWWDVANRRVRTAEAPSRLLGISGAPGGSGLSGSQEQPGADATGAEARVDEPSAGTAESEEDTRLEGAGPESPRRPAWALAALFAALAVIGFVGWFLTARHLKHGARQARPGSKDTLAGLPSGRRSGEGSTSLRARRRALRAACRSNDARAMHRELLAYLCSVYELPPGQAAARFRDAGHGAVLDALNAGLYGRSSASQADGATGNDLLAAVEALDSDARRTPEDPLPELYS